MRKKNARDVAVYILSSIRTKNAWSNLLLKKEISASRLDARDASLATTLVYGVLQNKILCDFYIAHFSKLKMNKITPKILDVLRVGVYQLIFLDKIPAFAAINQAVIQAKKDNPRAAGFVNALLRKISEAQDSLPEISGDPAFVLSVKYSHPLWLTSRLLDCFDESTTEKLLRTNNEIPKTTARINSLKCNLQQAVSRLSEEGVCAYPHEFLDNCIYISDYGNVETLLAYTDGLITIQDTASQLAALSCGAVKGTTALDACSAPGGKAFILAQMMENDGYILACDIHEHKLSIIEKNAKRQGIECIEANLCDASEFNPAYENEFDLVLADVPCSGLGIIRKKPDIRYKSFEEINGLPELQSRILHNVARYVKPGGVIVYSTCTILPEENQLIIESFLKNNPQFKPECFELPAPIGQTQGSVLLLPHEYGTDGFFIAKLRRMA